MDRNSIGDVAGGSFADRRSLHRRARREELNTSVWWHAVVVSLGFAGENLRATMTGVDLPLLRDDLAHPGVVGPEAVAPTGTVDYTARAMA